MGADPVHIPTDFPIQWHTIQRHVLDAVAGEEFEVFVGGEKPLRAQMDSWRLRVLLQIQKIGLLTVPVR